MILKVDFLLEQVTTVNGWAGSTDSSVPVLQSQYITDGVIYPDTAKFFTADGPSPSLDYEVTHLIVDSAASAITARSNCDDLLVSNARASRLVSVCTSFKLAIPQKSAVLEPPAFTTITPNFPFGDVCEDWSRTTNTGPNDVLALYPSPDVHDVFPPAICEKDIHAVQIEGTGFLVVDGLKPTIELVDSFTLEVKLEVPQVALTLSDCEISPAVRRSIQSCTKIEMDLNTSVAKVGLYSVRVRNPAPVDGSTIRTNTGAIRVVARPLIQSTTLPIVCVKDGPATVILDGVGLLTIDADDSVVSIGGVEVNLVSKERCDSFTVTNFKTSYSMSICARYTVEVPSELDKDAEFYRPEITVQHPASQCKFATASTLMIAPAPRNDRVPEPVFCENSAATTITINGGLNGAGYIVFDGTPPEVFIGEVRLLDEAVEGSDCSRLMGFGRLEVVQAGNNKRNGPKPYLAPVHEHRTDARSSS